MIATVYTKPFCPYCTRALAILRKYPHITINEIEAYTDENKRLDMIAQANGKNTFPQVFIDGWHIGGSDELASLDRRGGLTKPIQQ